MLWHYHRLTGGVVAGDTALLLSYAVGEPVDFSRASVATYTDDDGLIQSAGVDVLRDNHYVNGVRTFLLEDARTNLCLRSSELDNVSWIKTSSSVSANATVGPDGAASADKVVEAAASAQHQIFPASNAFVISENYSFSIYLKSGGRDFVHLSFPSTRFGADRSAWFNLTLGTVVSAMTGVVAHIEDCGDGWYRCCISKVATSSGNGQCGILFNSSASTASYLGDGVSGIFGWGGQIESNTICSSLIATEGTAVVRAVDILTFDETWDSQLVTQYERWIDSSGVQTSVTEFTGTTMQGLTLNRAYTHVMVASGGRDEAFFTALL